VRNTVKYFKARLYEYGTGPWSERIRAKSQCN
jgi:hypothetical protein